MFDHAERIHGGLCHGSHFQILDQARLATIVGWTMVGRFVFVEAILRNENPATPSVVTAAKELACGQLGPVQSEPQRYHRDGWLFQHISWVAALVSQGPLVAISPPHIIPAHKGFDALMVPLEDATTALPCIVICEDKATENPRATIRDKVWPEIKEIEAGDKDAQLIQEHSVLLQRYQLTNARALMESSHWLNDRRYRVCLSLPESQSSGLSRQAVFDGFQNSAPGNDIRKRRADSIAFDDLRAWMDGFAELVVSSIRGMG